MTKKIIRNIVLIYINIVLIALMSIVCVSADNKTVKPEGKYYELKENNDDFTYADPDKTDRFIYGEERIGALSIEGNVKQIDPFNGFNVYLSYEALSFRYFYNGKHNSKDDDWMIEKSSIKRVQNVETSKIKKGVLIVQKSPDKYTWTTERIITDIFGDNTSELTDFYKVNEDDLRRTTYYRITVAYEMKHKINGRLKPEYKQFVEVYEFLVSYNGSPIKILDIDTGYEPNDHYSVNNGFKLDKCDSESIVTFEKDDDSIEISDMQSVYEPGLYNFSITNKIGKPYNRTIKIINGTQTRELKPTVYEGDKKSTYDETGPINSKTHSGNISLTNLKIGQKHGADIKKTQYNGIDAYGIIGDHVGLYMSINDLFDKDWEVIQDEYGEKEKETVNGVHVGDVSSGALLIQKSTNGYKWEQLDRYKYNKGLYTNDYYNHYANKGDVLIYTPSGEEVMNGIYIKVSYAYELYQKSTKEKVRVLEVYKFYVCCNDLNAVTFHNLTVNKQLAEKIGSDNEIESEIITKAETLLSGSGTITGFNIDISGCPLAKYSVSRNDSPFKVGISQKDKYQTNNITVDGKYEIRLESNLGDTRTLIIFVDTASSAEVYKRYFGEGFISEKQKRIYSYDSEVPVFEAEETGYQVCERDPFYLPISGIITNHSTNKSFKIYSGNSSILNEAGYYTAEFTTRPQNNDDSFPGDYHTYKFRFSIIEHGKAPGPVLNKQALAEFSKKNVSDSYPKYYGLTYQSAGKGTITRAFSTFEEAFAYAYNYEKGIVEKQDDGTYRYSPALISVYQRKELYDSEKELTDLINESAKMAVQESYFDATDKTSYCTLDEHTSMDNDNLRKLELKSSVIIFSEGQKEKMCNNELLPIISPKPYFIISENGLEKTDDQDFEFSRDKYGYDSDKVFITDCNGREYEIEYQKGVGKQLQEMNCPSGKVKITEKTVYGDETSYEAVFIAKGDNTSELTISCYKDGKLEPMVIDKSKNGSTIKADAFKIDKLTDTLDPYSIVRVTNKETLLKSYGVADDLGNLSFTSAGSYEVAVINRIGYYFTINVEIESAKYITISFEGEGTEGLDSILTEHGAENVTLPDPSREGYELAYFKDENGGKYYGTIDEIMFKGDTLLKAVWKDKQCRLSLVDSDGNTIRTEILDIGSSYSLPNPRIKDGNDYINICWLRDGTPVEGNFINIDSYDDITLVASAISAERPDEVIEKTVVEETEDDNHTYNAAVVSGMVIVSSLAGLLIGRSTVRKKKGER